MHLNIPTTSQSDQKLSKNQTTDQQDAMIVIKLLAKCSASNPLWAVLLVGRSSAAASNGLKGRSIVIVNARNALRLPRDGN